MIKTQVFKKNGTVVCHPWKPKSGIIPDMAMSGWQYCGLINLDVEVLRGLIDHLDCWADVMETADDTGQIQTFLNTRGVDIPCPTVSDDPSDSGLFHDGDGLHT